MGQNGSSLAAGNVQFLGVNWPFDRTSDCLVELLLGQPIVVRDRRAGGDRSGCKAATGGAVAHQPSPGPSEREKATADHGDQLALAAFRACVARVVAPESDHGPIPPVHSGLASDPGTVLKPVAALIETVGNGQSLFD